MGSFTKEEVIQAIRELDDLATSRGSDAIVTAAIRKLAQRFVPPRTPTVEDVGVFVGITYGHDNKALADIVGIARPSGFYWLEGDEFGAAAGGRNTLQVQAPTFELYRWFADCLVAHAAGCPPHWVDMGFKAASLGGRWLYKQDKIVLVSANKSAGGSWVVYDCTVSDVNAPTYGCLNEMEARLKASEIVTGAS